MVGRAASLSGAKISELEKEIPRLMLAGGAGPAPHSPGGQEGRAECPLSCPSSAVTSTAGRWREGILPLHGQGHSYSLCHS